MTLRLFLSIGLALICAGYLVVAFGYLVLDDVSISRDAGQDAAGDAETVEWLGHLREPDPEFAVWCEQAISLTRDPADTDLSLWEHELGGEA